MEQEALANLREIKGASDFLHKLTEGRWAVATSSSSASAKAKMKTVGMPIPAVLIGADAVQNGKPHPETYLTASMDLGYTPENCLAFEDSETGVRSALAAGCHVLQVGLHGQISDPRILGQVEDFSKIGLVAHGGVSMEIEFKQARCGSD